MWPHHSTSAAPGATVSRETRRSSPALSPVAQGAGGSAASAAARRALAASRRRPRGLARPGGLLDQGFEKVALTKAGAAPGPTVHSVAEVEVQSPDQPVKV